MITSPKKRIGEAVESDKRKRRALMGVGYECQLQMFALREGAPVLNGAHAVMGFVSHTQQVRA